MTFLYLVIWELSRIILAMLELQITNPPSNSKSVTHNGKDSKNFQSFKTWPNYVSSDLKYECKDFTIEKDHKASFSAGEIMVLIFYILCFSKCNIYVIVGNIA